MSFQIATPSLSAEAATKAEQERARILRTLVWLMVGLGATSVLALLASQCKGYTAAIGICMLITLAALMGGGALGFLFALPRVLSDSAPTPAPPPATTPPGGGGSSAAANGGDGTAAPAAVRQAAARLLQSNTNLERISDWLTTMLVGVSLTQLTNVPRLMGQFHLFLQENAQVFATAATSKGTAQAVANATAPKGTPPVATSAAEQAAQWLPMVGCTLLILAALVGFMAMYLYMRLVLVRLFLQTEIDLQGRPENEAKAEVLPVAIERQLREVISDPATTDVIRQSSILEKDVLSVGDALDVINEELYEENFDRAIQIADSLARTSAAKDPDYWLYRAAAYGQKHHSLSGSSALAAAPNAGAERDKAHQEVLRATHEAIKLDHDYRPALWALTNKRAIDNDLQDFADDAEFARLARPHKVWRR